MLIDDIKAAGFKSKAAFARHYGVWPSVVSRWGDNPPKWVIRVLEDRAALLDALQID